MPRAKLNDRTSGRVVLGRYWPGLSIEEVVLPAGLEIEDHRHRGAQLHIALEGVFAETIGGQRHCIAPGEAWYRDAGVLHSNRVVGGTFARGIIVTVRPPRLHWLERRGEGGRKVRGRLVDELCGDLARELRSRDSVTAPALEGHALLLLSHAERAIAIEPVANPTSDVVAAAFDWIDRHCGEPITLARVAEAVGVRSGLLAARFRRVAGQSVGEYIRTARLRGAFEALVTTAAPLSDVAVRFGFFDQAHLGRWCKRVYGLTPAELRDGR